jgi:hypothetical protein
LSESFTATFAVVAAVPLKAIASPPARPWPQFKRLAFEIAVAASNLLRL